jgi:hypothetical protein
LSTDTHVIRDYSSHIAGVDARTGTLKWEFPPAGTWICRSWTDVGAIEDTVILSSNGCVGDGENGPIALDATTGKVLWQKPSDRPVFSYGGVIQEVDPWTLLDPRSGRPLEVPIINGPAWSIGSGEIVSFDAGPGGKRTRPVTLTKIGEPAPRWQVLDISSSSVADVAALGDAVVILDECGMWVLNRSDGTERRRLDCGGLPRVFPDETPTLVPAPGALVVRGDEELVGIR